MATPYPEDAMDDLARFKSVLGTFWSDYLPSQDALAAFLRGRALLARKAGDKAALAQDCLSRSRVPVFELSRYEQLTLDPTTASVDPDAYTQGRPVNACLRYPAVEGVNGGSLITDRPLAPVVALVEGVDFAYDTDAQLTVVNDVSGDFWLRNARLDKELVWLYAGSVASIRLESSKQYKDLVNAVLDAAYNGPSRTCLDAALSAMCDAPRCASAGEIVEYVNPVGTYLLVITNKNVYRCALTATAVAAVGDVLTEGQWLTNAVVVMEPPLLAIPAGLTSLQIGGGMLDVATVGPLTFQNAAATITVTEGVDGYTKITWPMAGEVDDVTAFFNLLHSRGVAAGNTLANRLDLRPQPQTTQPSAASLPATVNPMELLFVALRNNFYVVHTTEAAFGSDALGLELAPSVLKKILPPGSGVLVLALGAGGGGSVPTVEASLNFALAPNSFYLSWGL